MIKIKRLFFAILILSVSLLTQSLEDMEIHEFPLPSDISRIYSIVSGDINANGSPDILCRIGNNENSEPQQIRLFEISKPGNAKILFQFNLQNFQSDAVLTSQAFGDLNGDGLEEIIVIANTTASPNLNAKSPDWLYVFEQNDSGFNNQPYRYNFQIDTENNILVRPQQIATTDFNRDGKDALVVALGSPERKVAVLSMTGEFASANWEIVETLSPKEITGYMNYVMTLGDVNNDNHKDIILTMIHNGINLVCYEFSGDHFQKIVNQHLDWNKKDAFPSQLAVFDIDDDAINEIIFTSPKNGITILHQRTPNKFQLSPYTNLKEYSDFALSRFHDGTELLLVHPQSKILSRLIPNSAGLDSRDGLSEYELVLPPAVQGNIIFFEESENKNIAVLRNKSGTHSILTISSLVKTATKGINNFRGDINAIVEDNQSGKKTPNMEPMIYDDQNRESEVADSTEKPLKKISKEPDYVIVVGNEFKHEIEVKVEAFGSSRTIFAAPDGMNEVSGNLVWVPNKTQLGFHHVAYEVTGPNITLSNEFYVYVNAIPEINSLPDTISTTGRLYTYQVDALDRNSDATLTYELFQFPNGAVISETGRIEWLPTKNQADVNQFVVRVSDGYSPIDQHFQIFCNDPVQFACTPDSVVFLGNKYSTQLIARDNNFIGNRKYSLLENPPGMTIDFPESPAPRVEWIPKGNLLDDVSVRFLVSDGFSTDTLAHNIFVNAAPEINSQPDTLLKYGTTYKYQVEAVDRNKNQPLTYKLLPGHPDEMKINEQIGLITWTPDSTKLDNFSFRYTVFDGFQSDTQNVKLFINFEPKLYGHPPHEVTLSDFNYYYKIKILDRNKNDEYTLDGNKLPPWCEWNKKESEIIGTPDRSDEGLWDFHFVITDNHGAKVPYKFKVRVVDNPRQSSYVFSVYFFILPAIAAGYLLLK